MNKKTGTEAYYLVEKSTQKGNNLIYEIEEYDEQIFVFLKQNLLGKRVGTECIGIVSKINKRGLTFTSGFLSEKLIEIFVSNGEFNRMTKKELDIYLE